MGVEVRVNPTAISIRLINGAGLPVSNARVALLDSKTHGEIQRTDSQGYARLSLPPTGHVNIWCAHRDYESYVLNDQAGTQEALTLKLQERSGAGSILAQDGTELLLPNIEGIMKITDGRFDSGTVRVDGKKVSIDNLLIGHRLMLDDDRGHRLTMALKARQGDLFLFDFDTP
jgi:hypothetical protein